MTPHAAVASPSEDDLLDALELGNLVLGPVEGVATYLDIERFVGRETPISLPSRTSSRWPASSPRARTRRSRAFATATRAPARASAGWSAPRTRPANLPGRLEAAGMRVCKEQLALADTDLDRPIPTSPDVAVRVAARADIDTIDRLKAASFDMPLASARWIDEMLFGAAEQQGTLVFHLATIDGEPAASSQTLLWRDKGIAILAGAGTLPGARGRGVFRTLLAHRYAYARALGIRAATIQAYEDTSAPICKRLGFRELGRLTLYTWSPPA